MINAKLYSDINWQLLWPEGDPMEQWLEGAVLRIYQERYGGSFSGSIEN